MSLRTLDRALWKYSKEHQPLPKASAGNPSAVSRSTVQTPGPTKSDMMRSLYESGYTVAQVATGLHVAYGFAYGVHKRWQESRQGR